MTDAAELRSAAKTVRAQAGLYPAGVAEAIADLLNTEAALRGELEPFMELINAAIEQESGVAGYLRFGYNEKGEIDMHADSIEACLALARLINGGEQP